MEAQSTSSENKINSIPQSIDIEAVTQLQKSDPIKTPIIDLEQNEPIQTNIANQFQLQLPSQIQYHTQNKEPSQIVQSNTENKPSFTASETNVQLLQQNIFPIPSGSPVSPPNSSEKAKENADSSKQPSEEKQKKLKKPRKEIHDYSWQKYSKDDWEIEQLKDFLQENRKNLINTDKLDVELNQKENEAKPQISNFKNSITAIASSIEQRIRKQGLLNEKKKVCKQTGAIDKEKGNFDIQDQSDPFIDDNELDDLGEGRMGMCDVKQKDFKAIKGDFKKLVESKKQKKRMKLVSKTSEKVAIDPKKKMQPKKAKREKKMNESNLALKQSAKQSAKKSAKKSLKKTAEEAPVIFETPPKSSKSKADLENSGGNIKNDQSNEKSNDNIVKPDYKPLELVIEIDVPIENKGVLLANPSVPQSSQNEQKIAFIQQEQSQITIETIKKQLESLKSVSRPSNNQENPIVIEEEVENIMNNPQKKFHENNK